MKRIIIGLIIAVMLIFSAGSFSMPESEVDMPYIPQVKVGNTIYNLKDTEAQRKCSQMFPGAALDTVQIDGNTDINNLTTPGCYRITSNSIARTMIHLPDELQGRIYVYSGGTSVAINQIYITDYYSKIYVRGYRNNVSMWSEWVAYDKSEKINLIEDQIIGLSNILADGFLTKNYTLEDLTTGKYVNYQTGEIAGNDTYACSGYVPIPPGTEIIEHSFSYSTSGSAGWALYDKDKQRITGGHGDSVIHYVNGSAYFAVSEQLNRFEDSVYITFYSSAASKGNVNKTIVMLGDSIIGAFRGNDSIPAYVEQFSGATCYNCGFGATAMGNDTKGSTEPDRETFCGWKILSAIAANDYSEQDAAIEGQSSFIQEHAHFADSLALLKSIDWASVDILTVSYGTNDFGLSVKIPDNQENLNDPDTFGGAFRTGLEAFMAQYPHIKVVIFSPIWRAAVSGGAVTADFSKEKGSQDYYLWQYVEKEEDIAKEYGLPFRDMFYTTGFNRYTWTTYFPATDATHPNPTGRKSIGKMYADFLSQY